ncbi:hypothetical protein NDI52_25890 [Leptolyngbya sp. PL-A3]|uniref:hypothetical protein n=1 Tax=Leptolyngbya sp. PL-A3 TaxID=2933911 RepID=UPI0032972B0D
MIVSRFSSTPAMVEEADLPWHREAEHPSTAVDPTPSVEMPSHQSIKPVQPLHPAPEDDIAFNSIQRQVQQQFFLTSLPNQVVQPSFTLPQPNSKQVIFPTANSKSTSQFTIEEPNQKASLQPFQVLQPSQSVPVITHLSRSTEQSDYGAPSASRNEANNLLDKPLSAQNYSDRSTASRQSKTTGNNLFTQPITLQDYNDRSNNQDHSMTGNSSSLPQSAAPINLNLALRDSYPQSLAESVVASPTIRVIIGRVEVRAMMPTPSAPKATPVRSRPAVSLDTYLKQRRS